MSAQYQLLTAFAEVPASGNPAAILYADIGLSSNVCADVARNLNQPILSLVSDSPLTTDKPKTAAFGIRWFTISGLEVPLCGHGTLAAAKAILDREDVANDTEVVEFHTTSRGILTARKVEGGLIEIELPSTTTVKLPDHEHERVSNIISRAVGKDVPIEYLAHGVDGFKNYLFIVMSESVNLKSLRVDGRTLNEAGFLVNVFTTKSSSGNERFVSRMFAPGNISGDEDHVCGSAHCLLTPYWSERLGIPRGQAFKARQVSPRGGDLRVVWDSEENKIRLSGSVTRLSKGELDLDGYSA